MGPPLKPSNAVLVGKRRRSAVRELSPRAEARDTKLAPPPTEPPAPAAPAPDMGMGGMY